MRIPNNMAIDCRFLAIIPLLIFTGCGRFLNIDPPPNQLVKSTVFSDDRSAYAALAGIYRNLARGSISANLQLAIGLCSDELNYNSSNEIYNQFAANSVEPENSHNQAFWTELYNYIYNANSVMEGLNEASGVTHPVKDQLIGEAKFIRAFAYFYLVNLWGDVPLITTTEYTVNQSLGRETTSLVYAQIVKDLGEAKTLLSNAEPRGGERIYIDYYTASALLAKIHLYLGNWQEAIEESNIIIGNPDFSMASLSEAFVKNSSETIWQLESVNPSFNTNIGQQLIPSSPNAIPFYSLTENFLVTIENGDSRKEHWINNNVSQNVVYHYPYKYKIGTASPRNEHLIVFRLAEQYLIRAEAKAQLDIIEGENGALTDLNSVRQRAGLQPLLGLSKEESLQAIYKERRVEFLMEWGNRWLDLKRNGMLDSTISSIKGGYWQATDSFWPIPLQELQRNPFLTQNEGY